MRYWEREKQGEEGETEKGKSTEEKGRRKGDAKRRERNGAK